MTTTSPFELREAIADEDERDALLSDLARAGISTHDNVADLFLATARAGTSCAIYLLQAGTRPRASLSTTRVGYAMDMLWGNQEPDAGEGESQTIRWLDHCLVTLAAFDPWSEDAAAPVAVTGTATGVVTGVGLFAGMLEAAGSGAFQVNRLAEAGRDLARRAGYDSALEARRARMPWAAIEDLNSAQTAVGDLAIAQLAGRRLDLDQLALFTESTAALNVRAEVWRERESRPPSGASEPARGRGRDAAGSSLAHSAAGLSVLDRFELPDTPRNGDTRGLIRVWYGTDRAPVHGDARQGFTNHPSPAGEAHYGQCMVWIPRAHRFGEVKTPLWDRLVRRAGNGRLRLEDIEPAASAADFAASIDAVLGNVEDRDRTATVFVHGYNTSFEAAVIRAAQMGFDLRVGGVTALFSWPSAAKWAQYLRDADNVEHSEPALSEFLDTLTTATSLTRVNFIVHSMGNRLVARTLTSLAPRLQASGVQVGAIVLAAPDINVRMFKQLAHVYPALCSNTTMYVSEADKALAVSYRGVWRTPRAGFTPPITVVPGVHTIEVSGVDASRLGHGYYAAAEPVLYDIHPVLDGGSDPGRRPRIQAITSPAGAYWLLTS